MNQWEFEFRSVITDIMKYGHDTGDRTGVGTREMLNRVIRVHPSPYFPMLTGRKLYIKGVFGELAAFLKGETAVQGFKDFGCNYWDDFADSGGGLGPIYGYQWRYGGGRDQLAAAMDGLTKNTNSRQLIVGAWNSADLMAMCLPPCHFAFQLNRRGDVLTLTVYQRSLDVMVGLPSDVILYGLLHRIIAYELDLVVGELAFMVGSAHIYNNHFEAAREYLLRSYHPLPSLKILDPAISIQNFHPDMVKLESYEHEPPLTASLELNL